MCSLVPTGTYLDTYFVHIKASFWLEQAMYELYDSIAGRSVEQFETYNEAWQYRLDEIPRNCSMQSIGLSIRKYEEA